MYIVLVMNVWENQYKVQYIYIYAKYQHGIVQRKYVNNKTEM
jgi:hypothetical protein